MPRAFTLLEILVVLAFLLLLMAVAAVQLQGPYHAARLEDAVRQIAFVDSQARAHARTHAAPGEFVFQLNRRCVAVETAQAESTRHLTCRLPHWLAITSVATPHWQVGSGTVRIPFSVQGISPTYAICLTAPHRPPRWLLVAGGSGQLAQLRDEDHVQGVLRYLAARGADAP